MTLEAIRTAKDSANLQLEASYQALCSLLVTNEAALGLLTSLASLALEKHVLDQIELEIIANGSSSITARPLTIEQAIEAEGRILDGSDSGI